MAKATIIGRVSIKVIPDTSGFRRETEAKLNAIEGALDSVEVDIDLKGERGFISRAKMVGERAQQAVDDIKMHLRFDQRDYWETRAALERLKRKMDDMRKRIVVKIDVDDPEAVRKAAARIREMNERAHVKIRYHSDDIGYRKVLNQLRAIKRERLEKEVRFSTDPQQLDDTIRRFEDKLKAFERNREIEYKYRHDRDSLNRVLREMQGALDRTSEVTIKAKSDPASIRNAMRAIQKQLDGTPHTFKVRAETERGQLERMIQQIRGALADQTMEIKVDADDKSLRRKLGELERRHKILLDTENLQKAMARIREDMEKKVRVELDDVSARHVRRKLQDLYDDFDGDEIDFEVAANSILARAELARVSRDRIVLLHVRVSQRSLRAAERSIAALAGGRMLWATLDNLKELFENFDKNIPLIGSVALAIQGLSAWLLTAASNTFSLSRGLAQIAGAGLALPGILGGFAVGIGATIAVLKDFPNVMPDVIAAFKGLQSVMSDTFWRQAEAPLRRFIDVIWPEFANGMAMTSHALGTFFASISNSMSRHLGGTMTGMFQNLYRSIAIAGGGTESWAKWTEILGRRGSEYLPRMAQWYVRISDRFADWLEQADKSGKLVGYIELGVTRMREFGRVISNTASLLTSLAKAAERAGGSTLKTLGDTMERLAKAAKSKAFQDGLANALAAAHEAMTRISDKSGPAFKSFLVDLGDTFTRVLPRAGDALGDLLDGVFTALGSKGMMAGLLSMFDGLALGIATLQPMWRPMGDALGALGQIIGNLAKNFGPLLASLFVQLSQTVIELTPAITRMADNLTGQLLWAMETLGPIILSVVEALVKMLSVITSSPIGSALFVGLLASIHAVSAAVRLFSTTDVALLVSQLRHYIPAAVAKAKGALAGMAAVAQTVGTGLVTVVRDPRAGFAKLGGAVKGATSKLGGLGAGLASLAGGPVTLAAAAIAGLTIAAVDYGTGAQVAITSTHEFAAALSGLGKSVDFDKLNSMFGGGSDNWTRFLTTAPKGADQIQRLGDAIGVMSRNANASHWDKFWGTTDGYLGLWIKSGKSKQAVQGMEEFDAAMAQLVNSGNADAIAQAQTYIAEEAAYAGTTFKAFTEQHMPNYTEATRTAAVTAAAAAHDVAELGRATNKLHSTFEGATGLSLDMAASINEASKAFIDFSQDVDNAEMSTKDWMKNLADQVKAQEEWAENMATLAKKGVDAVVLDHLARLGPEGASRVADMVDMTDKELQQWSATMVDGINGGLEMTDKAMQEFAPLIQEALRGVDLSGLGEEYGQMAEDLGLTIIDGVVVGVRDKEAIDDAMHFALSGLGRGWVTDDMLASIEAMGYKLPEKVADGIELYGPQGLADALNQNLAGLDTSTFPPSVLAHLTALGYVPEEQITAAMRTSQGQSIKAAIQDTLNDSLVGANLSPSQVAALNNLGIQIPEGVADGIPANPRAVANALADELLNSNVAGMPPGLQAQLMALGLDIVNGVVVGIDGSSHLLNAPGESMGEAVTSGFRGSMAIKSPSQVMATLGGFVVSGLVQGIEGASGLVTGAAEGLGGLIKSAFSGAKTFLTPEGSQIGGGLISGLLSRSRDGHASGKALGGTIAKGTEQPNYSRTGTGIGSKIIEGVRSRSEAANTAGRTLGTRVESGLTFISFAKTAASMMSLFIGGLRAAVALASAAGRSIANAVVRPLRGISAFSSGRAIGQTFASGIRSATGAAVAAARAMAAAVRATLPRSPAKDGPFSGSGWGGWGEAIADELVYGLKVRTGNVRSASDSMMRAVNLSASPSLATAGSGASGGDVSITNHFDVTDLRGIQSLEEFMEKFAVWASQGARRG